jgi:hypothetical protein
MKYIYNKIEFYTYPITMPFYKWRNYITSGENTLYGDALSPDGTMINGAVQMGHVRQNPMTAMLS